MNEAVLLLLEREVAFYNPKPRTASFPARKIIRINTHAILSRGRAFKAA